jgi:terminal oxidase heme-binding subunit I
MKIAEDFIDFVKRLFQWNKPWESRVLMASLVFGVVWAVVGGSDALLVRLQESSFGATGQLITTPWDYYAGLTLHATRMLFGFAQQIEMGVFVFLTVRLLGIRPRAKGLIGLSLFLINASIFLFEGPLPKDLSFIDSYFSATGWDSLAPLGVSGYSQYVVSPLWWLGWLFLEVSTFLWGAWILYNVAKRPKGKLGYVMYFVVATTLLFILGYLAPFISTNWELLTPYLHLPLNTVYNQVIFWFYGHSVVYMVFLPAVTTLYFLVPTLVNREVYSVRMAKTSAILYLAFSNVVPIHHLYLTVFPYWVNLFQEVVTYGVVVPSIMTFFNLWATAKGVKNLTWSVPAAFTALSFGGAIGAGVTGVANATVSFDAIIHNTMWVPGHFHAMIILMIVPALFALLYLLIPMVTGRAWYSVGLSWAHFWLTLVGAAGISVFFDALGLDGILRRSMIYPRTGDVVLDEIGATVFALVFGVGQVFFVLNTTGTLFRGKPLRVLSGASFKQTVFAAAATTTNKRFEPPQPPALRIEEETKRRAEIRWTVLAVLLLALTALTTFPSAVVEGGSLANIPAAYLGDAPAVTHISVAVYQYYWLFTNMEAPNSSTVNFFVVRPNQRLLFNGTTARGNALAEFYMPLFNDRVVANELYQGYQSYFWLTTPQTAGVYGFANGEYDGPFFSYMGGEMIVMPPSGLMNSSEMESYQKAVAQDPYTPSLVEGAGVFWLQMSDYGMWNDSDPAPTLLVANGSSVTLDFTVTQQALAAYADYVFNLTQANTPQSVKQYLKQSGGRLPFRIELLHVSPQGDIQLVQSFIPSIQKVNSLTFEAEPGVYVYGVVNPIHYSFDPYNLSNEFLGQDSGQITSLWGTILVTQS